MVVSPKDNKGGGIVKKYNDTLIKMYIFLGLVVTTICPGLIDAAGFIKKGFFGWFYSGV